MEIGFVAFPLPLTLVGCSMGVGFVAFPLPLGRPVVGSIGALVFTTPSFDPPLTMGCRLRIGEIPPPPPADSGCCGS